MTLSRRRQGAGAASRQREDDESWSLGGLTPPTHHLRRRSQLSLAALLCVLALSLVPVSSASIVLTVSVAEKKKSVSEQRERDENLETNLPLSLASSSLSISPLFFPSIALTPPPETTRSPPSNPSINKTTKQQNGNVTFDAIQDMPADFGPRLPPAGLAGLLVVATPLDGCAPQGGGGQLAPPSREAVPAGATWIALIERSPPPPPPSEGARGGRGGFALATDEDLPRKRALPPPPPPNLGPPRPSPPCSFDAKVRAAAAAGASAAIIFDDAPGQPLIIMAKAGGAPEPTIPAVFISAEGAFFFFF